MKGNLELTLIEQGSFLGTQCDFYKDKDGNDIYMTRNQVGRALKYNTPRISISNIHKRNKDRLSKFSTVIKLITLEGTREIERGTVVYSERGIYDICRFSKQPVADEFYDWVYEKILLIRKTGGTVELGSEEKFLDNYFPLLTEETKLMIIKDLSQGIKKQEEQIKKLKPMAENRLAYIDTKGNITMSIVAKSLNIKDVGPNNLLRILKDKKILKQNGEPYQTYINRGYFERINTCGGKQKLYEVVITGKGISWIKKQMEKWGYMTLSA